MAWVRRSSMSAQVLGVLRGGGYDGAGVDADADGLGHGLHCAGLGEGCAVIVAQLGNSCDAPRCGLLGGGEGGFGSAGHGGGLEWAGGGVVGVVGFYLVDFVHQLLGEGGVKGGVAGVDAADGEGFADVDGVEVDGLSGVVKAGADDEGAVGTLFAEVAERRGVGGGLVELAL